MNKYLSSPRITNFFVSQKISSIRYTLVQYNHTAVNLMYKPPSQWQPPSDLLPILYLNDNKAYILKQFPVLKFLVWVLRSCVWSRRYSAYHGSCHLPSRFILGAICSKQWQTSLTINHMEQQNSFWISKTSYSLTWLQSTTAFLEWGRTTCQNSYYSFCCNLWCICVLSEKKIVCS